MVISASPSKTFSNVMSHISLRGGTANPANSDLELKALRRASTDVNKVKAMRVEAETKGA